MAFPKGLRPGDSGFEKASMAANRQWLDIAASETGRTKLSGLHEDQLESYLRETSIMDKVLPPDAVDPSECEIGTDNDTLFYKLFFQFETRAYLGAFEALPTEVQEVFIPRIWMSFFMLTTPTYVINDYSLPAYPFPVHQQVEDSMGLDMQEAKDWSMLSKLEETIQASRGTHNNVLRGEEAVADIVGGANGTGATPVFRGRFAKGDMSTLQEHFVTKRTKLDRVIIPEKNFLEIQRWDLSSFGDQLIGEVVINGYRYDQVFGVKFIRTIKIDSQQGDVFREGNLYGFATPNEVGRNKTLRGIKFHFDRDHQFFSFDAQMAFGFLWAVSAKVVKMELYNGGLAVDNITCVPLYDTDIPGSDELWGDPEYVTQKDYYNIGEGFERPQIRFS